jgi:hypothetical protein
MYFPPIFLSDKTLAKKLHNEWVLHLEGDPNVDLRLKPTCEIFLKKMINGRVKVRIHSFLRVCHQPPRKKPETRRPILLILDFRHEYAQICLY